MPNPLRHAPDLRFAALACFLALLPLPAHAYIDPGSGSIVLQMVLAAIAGGVFFFRNALSQFFGLFRRNKPAATESSDDSDAGGEPR